MSTTQTQAIEIEREGGGETLDSDNENDIAEAAVEKIPAEEPDYSSMKVKQLTKAQRNKIIEDYDNGVDNQYFKVHKFKNGSVRIVKRSNPLSDQTADQRITEKYTGKRLTTEQLLMEHVLELEKKYEIMRLKHKKLKKRYNKLETDIFESSDDEEPATEIGSISREVQEPVKVSEPETLSQEPIITATFRARNKKPSWRNMISSM